jgi:heme-degrading monooxygenase HmoA
MCSSTGSLLSSEAVTMSEPFVAVSEISSEEDASANLIEAFRNRLGEVDHWPGFRHLEVWQDQRDDGRFLMVSWWDDETSFRSYMRSDSHRRSHARIPSEPSRPKPMGFDRFRLIAD